MNKFLLHGMNETVSYGKVLHRTLYARLQALALAMYTGCRALAVQATSGSKFAPPCEGQQCMCVTESSRSMSQPCRLQ